MNTAKTFRLLSTLLAVTFIVPMSGAWAAGDSYESATSGLPQFDPTYFASQIFWLAFTFICMYVAFSRTILPALSGTIENRNERIQSDLDKARQMKDKAEAVHQEYENILNEARAKASQTFSDMEADIERNSTRRIAEINKSSLESIQKTEKRLSTEKKKALKDMDKVAAEIASLAAERSVA